jgi:hypothetical protein
MTLTLPTPRLTVVVVVPPRLMVVVVLAAVPIVPGTGAAGPRC